MRFNSCELKQLATDPSVECTKEGVLCLREKEGKLWNKTDGELIRDPNQVFAIYKLLAKQKYLI